MDGDSESMFRYSAAIRLIVCFLLWNFWPRDSGLSGPVSRDIAMLSLRYPISRNTFSGRLVRKIRAPIKIKSALPPPKKPQTPNTPPPKRRNFVDMVFFCRKNAFFRGAHKIGAAISGPRIADKKFYGHEDFSELALTRNGAIPPLVLRLPQAHLCDTPSCNISRDNCAIPPSPPKKKQARKSFAILSLQALCWVRAASGPIFGGNNLFPLKVGLRWVFVNGLEWVQKWVRSGFLDNGAKAHSCAHFKPISGFSRKPTSYPV